MLTIKYLLAGLGVRPDAITLEFGAVLLLKLVLYPLLAYLLMLPFNLDPLVRTVGLMVAAMPSMVSTPLFVEKIRGGDSDFAVTGVFVTTLLSIVTIPLISRPVRVRLRLSPGGRWGLRRAVRGLSFRPWGPAR